MTTTDTTHTDAAGSAAGRSRIERYDPTEIEPRWQARWDERALHDTDLDDTRRRKFYLLTMYPYPSGDLHIGHWYIKTPTDAIARFRRMHGDNVFFPIGFDAFGLPAENAAIKSSVHPAHLDDAQHREHAPPAADDGRDVRLGRRGRHLRARVLPLEPVVLPAVPGARAGLPRDGAGRLVPQGPGRAGARAGRGRQPRLLALRHAGHQARPRAVVLPDHEVRDELLDFSEIDWPEPIRRHADQLDRALRGRRDRVRVAPDAVDARPPRRRAARSCASSPPAPTRCSARRSWSWRPSTRWSSS